MKVFANFLTLSMVVAVISGCASDSVYVPRVPSGVQAQLLDYFEQPDNKVFILAVDPGGSYAIGYDYGKASIRDAAKSAVKQCDDNRKAYGIVAKPYVYAINGTVVYEGMIRKAHAKGVAAEREAQKEELLKQQDAPVEEATEAAAEDTAEEPVEEALEAAAEETEAEQQ